MARARGGARRSIGGCPHQALARQDEAISRLATVPRCELLLSARTEHSGREFPSGRRQPKAQSRSVKWTGAVGRFPQSRPGKHHGPGGAGIPYAVCARIPWFGGRRPLGAAPAQTNPRSPRGGPFRRSNRPLRSCQLCQTLTVGSAVRPAPCITGAMPPCASSRKACRVSNRMSPTGDLGCLECERQERAPNRDGHAPVH